jgi:hypothetical protein
MALPLHIGVTLVRGQQVGNGGAALTGQSLALLDEGFEMGKVVV